MKVGISCLEVEKTAEVWKKEREKMDTWLRGQKSSSYVVSTGDSLSFLVMLAVVPNGELLMEYYTAGMLLFFNLPINTLLLYPLKCLLLPASLSSPQFTQCVCLLPCFPEKSVSVLLALLFQFIIQHPSTMTHASSQSLWPVWEPATAVQSFTYWTMVRGGMTRGSQPLYVHRLVVFRVWHWYNS